MSALLNNQNIFAYYDSNTDRIVPANGASGAIYVLTQDPLPQTYDFTYVATTDYAASSYVTGSVGQKKTVKQYNTGASSGNVAKLTSFYYRDSGNPTFITQIVESSTTVG